MIGMLNLKKLGEEIEAENQELRDKALRAITSPDVSIGDLVIIDCLLAIHRRQGDEILIKMGYGR